MIKIFTLLAIYCFFIVQPMSLQEYHHLQRTTPQLLFSDLDLDDTHNYPTLQKLVFLTPWNKKGHQLSIKYANKLNMVSPCWYSLQVDEKGQPKFQNIHNYDESYHKQIKQKNPNIKLVPRIYVDGSQSSFFKSIGNNRLNFERTIILISDLVKKHNFDGIVWDTPYNFFQKSRAAFNFMITDLIINLRNSFGSSKMILFNMASPADHMTSLDAGSYKKLPIDRLLIQNYDKGGRFLNIIDKAIQWKNNNVITVPIILMLPFFSVSENGQPLSTQEVADMINQKGFASSRMSQGMCLMGTKNRRRFYVPCFSYFSEAWAKAQRAQAGVGFWQGGNGLENYYKFM